MKDRKRRKCLQKKKADYDERLHNSNFIDACNNAVNGIVYSTSSQTNIRKQLILGAIVLILSLFYDFSTSEFLILTFAIFFVIFAEMINTAIETVVDLYTDVYHPKAKIAKDVAAGAVLFASVNAVIVAYFLILKTNRINSIKRKCFKWSYCFTNSYGFCGINTCYNLDYCS